MAKQKSTKRALLSSGLALLVCASMLIGTTFAWFTDSATAGVNKIQSGNLDVALKMEVGGEWADAEGATLSFTENYWEPGCTYSLPKLRVINEGNLALKYKVVLTGINGDAELNEAIEWTIGYVDSTAALGDERSLLAGAYEDFTIKGHMKEDAGNEYMDLTIDGISITVYATQDTVEADITGTDYDAGATLPSFWDGETAEDLTADEAGVYHITNAAQFVDYMNSVNKNDGKNYYNVELDCDIDLGGRIIEVSHTAAAFSGSFDGKNHTVSNYVIVRNDTCAYTGLFSIEGWAQDGRSTSFKNLTVKNGTVISNGPQVSAIVPNVEKSGNIVENCHAIDCTVIGEKKVGAIAAYVVDGTVKDCSATNCNIYASDERANQVSVYGYDNSGTFTNNATPVNCDLRYNIAVTAVSNAAELATALDNAGNAPSYDRNIILIADIDGSDWTAIPGGSNYPAVMIDGNGHTIKNLSACLFSSLPGRDYEFKNINFTNVALDAASGNNTGIGVLVGEGMANNGGSYTITNCHIIGGTIDGGSSKYVGGFIGFISTGANVEFTDCSVTDVALTSAEESIGAFAGHLYNTVTLTNCAVKGSTSVTCTADRSGGAAKAGKLVGTICGATNITNCTIDSTVTLSNYNALDAINGGLIGRNPYNATITVN